MLVIVILMMIAVVLDLYIGDSADHDDCGGGWTVALKLYETEACRINHFWSTALLQLEGKK
jgi:hypothetical protein